MLKRQRTILGIVLREIGRKRPEATLENSARLSQLDNLLVRAERIRNQRPKDKDKLYALHAPEVECIGKGKARKRYEFGVKVGIAVTHKQGWIWAQGHIRAIPMMDRFYANNWNK